MSEASSVIIGASHAAAQLAVSLRQSGWEGRIVVIGDEPYFPYNRPPLSKTFLSGEKQVDDLLIRAGAQYEKADIEFLLGKQATAIDRVNKVVHLNSGESVSYEKLAITTGARVRKLEVPGSELKGVCYLRDIKDVEQIRPFIGPGKKAVIVGGGYIGLETAAMLKKLLLDVTILEVSDRVLSRVTTPEISSFYTRVHQEEGVKIETGVGMTTISGDDCVREVTCSDGRVFPADLVVIGIGVIPNTELAEEAGLEVNNGILVDKHCLTNDPDIAAAGDCTRFYHPFYERELRLESVQNAMDQAKVAAAAMCGKKAEYNSLPWFWSDQYNLKLQMAGLSQGFDEVVLRGNPQEGRKFAAFYFKDGKVISVDAVNSPQEFMLGKQIISKGLDVDKLKLNDASIPMKELMA